MQYVAAFLKPRLLAGSLALTAGLVGATAYGIEPTAGQYDETAALQYSQVAIGRTVGDYVFTTSLNRKVRLAEFRGKPLIVSLIYTGCADVCPVVSETLADAVGIAREELGKDAFRVVTIGFDARHDTPERMNAFARSHGLDPSDWQFLTADGDTVDRLTEDLGFVFFPSPRGFDHMSQTTVLDPEGRVFRQIYGARFETPVLVEALKDLVLGRNADPQSLAGIINKVRLFCTYYDPATGRYRFSYSIFISTVLGALSLASIAVILVRSWLGRRRPHAS